MNLPTTAIEIVVVEIVQKLNKLMHLDLIFNDNTGGGTIIKH